jgi:DegV family protein with EDD domain
MQAKTPIIVTDSSVSLPKHMVEALPLFTVPLEIHHDGRVYQDGVDIDAPAFYALQRGSAQLPTTSAPQPGAFLDAFHRAAESTRDIICVTLSSDLSATYESALVAKSEAERLISGVSITVVNSRSAGTAQGLIVLDAARQAAGGTSLNGVLERIDQRITDVSLFGYLDTLYYVWRGGRVPRVFMWMGRLLGVKPVLQLADGKIGMIARPRTQAKAMRKVVALASDRLAGQTSRVAVMHANAPDKAEVLAGMLREALSPEELFITEFTPVIGAHTGPGLVGCAVHPVD